MDRNYIVDLYIGTTFWQTIAMGPENMGSDYKIPWQQPIPTPGVFPPFFEQTVTTRNLVFGFDRLIAERRAVYKLIDITGK